MLKPEELVSVRRNDVDAETACSVDSSPDPILDEKLHEILQREYEIDEHDVIEKASENRPLEGTADLGHRSVDNDEYEYEFRLFAKSRSGEPVRREHYPTSQKIAIRSPTPEDKEPGFINALRHNSYYFSSDQDQSKKDAFAAAAVSGQDVLKMSTMKWKGAELHWRVSVLKEISSKYVKIDRRFTGVNRTAGKRSGKKRRILFRKRAQDEKARKDLANRSQAEKGIAEKEKRTRKNREKKVKRKQKEKIKKIEAMDISGD